MHKTGIQWRGNYFWIGRAETGTPKRKGLCQIWTAFLSQKTVFSKKRFSPNMNQKQKSSPNFDCVFWFRK